MYACRYDTLNTNSLRLWSAMPDLEIDLTKFNEGEYGSALAARQRALEITQVQSPHQTSARAPRKQVHHVHAFEYRMNIKSYKIVMSCFMEISEILVYVDLELSARGLVLLSSENS